MSYTDPGQNSAASRRWRAEHPDRARGHEKAYRTRLKHKALLALGGAECDGCGETDPAALSIDHIWGGGSRQRQGKNPYQAYTSVVAGQTEGLRVLCMSCQFKAREYGPFISLWPRGQVA